MKVLLRGQPRSWSSGPGTVVVTREDCAGVHGPPSRTLCPKRVSPRTRRAKPTVPELVALTAHFGKILMAGNVSSLLVSPPHHLDYLLAGQRSWGAVCRSSINFPFVRGAETRDANAETWGQEVS